MSKRRAYIRNRAVLYKLSGGEEVAKDKEISTNNMDYSQDMFAEYYDTEKDNMLSCVQRECNSTESERDIESNEANDGGDTSCNMLQEECAIQTSFIKCSTPDPQSNLFNVSLGPIGTRINEIIDAMLECPCNDSMYILDCPTCYMSLDYYYHLKETEEWMESQKLPTVEEIPMESSKSMNQRSISPNSSLQMLNSNSQLDQLVQLDNNTSNGKMETQQEVDYGDVIHTDISVGPSSTTNLTKLNIPFGQDLESSIEQMEQQILEEPISPVSYGHVHGMESPSSMDKQDKQYHLVNYQDHHAVQDSAEMQTPHSLMTLLPTKEDSVTHSKSISLQSTRATLKRPKGKMGSSKRVCINPTTSKSTPMKDLTQQSGEDYSSRLNSPSHSQEQQPSGMSDSQEQSNTLCPLAVGDSSHSTSSTQKGTYWWITSWEDRISLKRMEILLARVNPLGVVASATHLCRNHQGPHRHWLVRTPQMRKSQFGGTLLANCEIGLIQPPEPGSTLKEGIRRYVLYIKGKGPIALEKGVPFVGKLETLDGTNKRTKSEEIYNLVKEGWKMSDIVAKYPMMYQQIAKLMKYRPQTRKRTDLVYYWGKPGTGKTSTIVRISKALRQLYPQLETYFKLGGLSKWMDNYNNEPIVVIDDPVNSSSLKTGDEEPIQRFKNLISTGPVIVEIKCGSMVFDSPLVVILSNIHPEELAQACGLDNEEAIYRRLTDTCGAHKIDSRHDAVNKMTEHYLQCVKICMKHNYDIDIDIEAVIQAIGPHDSCSYSNIKFKECDALKYFSVNSQ